MHVTAKAPGISSPGLLSTTICMRVVPSGVDRARRGVDYVGSTMAGIFRHGDLHRGVELDRRHIILRDVDVKPSLGMSEITNRARPALLSAPISAPTSVLRVVTMPSNGAVTRLKAATASRRSTAACAAGQRLLDREVAGLLVDRLARHGVGAAELLPAPRRHRRQRLGGLGAGQRRLGLQELLVEVGRLDLGQQLAGLHVRADIDMPGLEVAADAGIDRRAGIGLEPARQVKRDGWRRWSAAHARPGNGLVIGPSLSGLLALRFSPLATTTTTTAGRPHPRWQAAAPRWAAGCRADQATWELQGAPARPVLPWRR